MPWKRGLAPAILHVRGQEIRLSGPEPDVELAADSMNELIAGSRRRLHDGRRRRARQAVASFCCKLSPPACKTRTCPHQPWQDDSPQTLGQKAYVDAIDENTIVFGIGPAGTGKTYLAMAKAVVALHQKQVSRIVLTGRWSRAKQSLGFLPGSLNDKIDPYMRPL